MAPYALPLYGTDPDEQRRRLFPGLEMQPVPKTPPWLTPAAPPPAPAQPDTARTALLPRPAVAPIAPEVPASQPQPNPLAKVVPVAASGPNLQQDALQGQVARPVASDYKPQPRSFGQGLRDKLAAGLVGFKDPAEGARMAERSSSLPRVQAQQAFQNDTGTFNTAFNQGIQAQQAQREGENTASEIKYREAQTANLENKDTATLAKSGLMRDQQGNIVPVPEDQLAPELRQRITNEKSLNDLRTSQKNLADARAELTLAGNDPNSPRYKQAQERINAELAKISQAQQSLGLRTEEFANKLQEQELVKPSGQAQSRASAAQAAIKVMPGLLDLVRKNGREMGPIMGRLNRGEIAIGDVDPNVAQLYSAMKSMYALQPAVHGFRNANFVTDLQTAIGTLERNPEAFIAGMQGLLPTLQAVADEGVTYRQRIVPGRPPQTPAPNTATPAQPAGGGKIIKYDAQGNRLP